MKLFFNRRNVLFLTAAIGVIMMPPAAFAKSRKSNDTGKTVHIVAFGDSLTAGYGLRSRSSFPVKLAKALKAKGHNVKVTNAGVSGDTTAAGLARLDWAVPSGTDAVILELGANDALRGLSPQKARVNLEEIILKLKRRGIEVLLAGMIAPRNLGAGYTQPFDDIFRSLAKKYDTVFYPFFLKGVALKPRLILSDGLHPNHRGVRVIVKNILPKVEELIGRITSRRLARSRE